VNAVRGERQTRWPIPNPSHDLSFPIRLMIRVHLMIGFAMRLMLANSPVLLIRIRCFTIHRYGPYGRRLPKTSGNKASG
jgi:hypothetical protein